MRYNYYALVFILLILGAIAQFAIADEIEEDQGVYEYVLTSVEGEFDTVSAQLEARFTENGFELLTKIDMMQEECKFRARVLILTDSAYMTELIRANTITAPFACQDRVNLFEDEAGLHVSIINPLNINRTILMEDHKYNQLAKSHRMKLRSTIESVVTGEKSQKHYGEIRDEGYIGRTMGIMAGGDFIDKLETLAEIKETEFNSVVDELANGLIKSDGEFGLKLHYVNHIPDVQIVVFGLSSPEMESRSFEIVEEGSDDSRGDFQCPGIAHGAGYPIEVVATQEGDIIRVKVTHVMYRMKMYFEDAGMMAFASNMAMPGSIQDEIETMVKKALKITE